MTARLALICRHPIKSHGRETLASVRLSAGAALPWDRFWAVAHDAARLADGWNACVNFARGAKAPQLMAITCSFDPETRQITLRHPHRDPIHFCPDAPEDQARFLDWVRPLNPEGRAAPARVIAHGVAMTDTDFPSISLLSLSSLADLGARMGMTLSPHRFRGNLWVEGWAPWAESALIGQQLRIGAALLEVVEPITRCNATKVDVDTGVTDADTLAALETAFGHRDFGVYARVIDGGEIALNDPVVLQ